MLTKRIIPCLDVDKGRVVKGKQFQNIKDVDDPVRLAKAYTEAGADELVFYDISATSENRKIFISTIEKIAQEISIPFTVGGGIASVGDFTEVLRAGADKVSVNSAAVRDPSIINKAAMKFGRQCVVLSMDVKRNKESWNVYINGGRIDTQIDAINWAKEGERLGAGEIVLNSIDMDGVKDGFDISLTRIISENVNIPVIASGGAGKSVDFYRILDEGKADAALAASVFHYGSINIKELKEYLYNQGLKIRRQT